jgi:hypothetical protein
LILFKGDDDAVAVLFCDITTDFCTVVFSEGPVTFEATVKLFSFASAGSVNCFCSALSICNFSTAAIIVFDVNC